MLDMILSLTSGRAGFDPSFKRPTYAATLKSCDITKKSVCGYIYHISACASGQTIYFRLFIQILFLFFYKYRLGKYAL